MIKKIINYDYVHSLLESFTKGDKQNSIKKLESYLKNNPGDIKARYNLAVMYQQTGNIKKSVGEYLSVVKRDNQHWQSLLNLGVLHFANSLFKESNKYLYAVLKIKKNYQPALRDIGTNHLQLANYRIAEKILSESLKLNPVDYINLNSLGLAKMYLDKHEEAKKIFEKSININKEYYISYNNLGLYFERVGNIDQAYKCYKKCLKINPNYPNALNNIGMLYFSFEENKKAFSCFEKALKINPKMVDLYFNLGLSYFHMRKFKEAEKYFKKGFSIDSSNYNGHYNYSFMLLALQDYQNGWKEFDYRLKKSARLNESSLFKEIKNKLWNQHDLNNKNVLVVREQGAGDEILYSSMYNDIIKLNNNVKIEADNRLLKIFKRSFGSKNNFVSENKLSKNKKSLKQIDCLIFAGSLGRIFRNQKNDFPKNNQYLFPDKHVVKTIKSRLNTISKKPKIGISWISKNKKFGKGKSMDLISLLPILNTKKASFVNLQYGDTSEEVNNFNNETGINIIDFKDIDKFNDFESLAALLESLDLLITVSNTTAHLAGAIGKETWVMAPKSESLLFYWNTGMVTTPWYPSIHIYPKINTWKNTINRINVDLKKWLKKTSKF